MNPPSKPQERELKLALPSQAAASQVIRKLRECGYTLHRPVILRNDDLYLDTYDWLLMKKKLSLRYRLENGQAMYTLKSLGGFDKGLAQRDETEITLEGAVEDPRKIPIESIKDEVQRIISPRKLVELAKVFTVRKQYPVVTPEGAKINLAFDTSSFARERQPAVRYPKKVHEMEGELKEGDISALNCLQKLMAENFHFAPSTESKLQRAIEVLQLTPLSRKASKETTVEIEDSLKTAIQKIITAEWQWFQTQLPGVNEDYDPEFVHQARVTTRRMRSAIKVFSEAIEKDNADYLAKELKWLAALFGDIRDIDVFNINLDNFQNKLDYFPGRTKSILEDGIRKLRHKPFTELLDALISPRYMDFANQITEFIQQGRVTSSLQTEGKTIRQFAPEVINRDFQAVMARGKDVLNNPEMKKFHLLRIEMKKLRYATEFMAPAYQGALAEFIQRMTEIQDCLGELQDTVFSQNFCLRLNKEWAEKSGDPRISLIIGEIYQYQADIAKERRDKFSGTWNKFASAETNRSLSEVFKEKKPAS